jgi:hypothetical protein
VENALGKLISYKQQNPTRFIPSFGSFRRVFSSILRVVCNVGASPQFAYRVIIICTGRNYLITPGVALAQFSRLTIYLGINFFRVAI